MRRAQRGYTYIGLLIAVAIAGVALGGAGEVWSTQAKREREEQLLFVGEQFQRAIASYYENTPGGIGQFPRSLEDLLEDRRLPTVRRHLRQIYVDPMTGGLQWGLDRSGPNNAIIGVHSMSTDVPIKRHGFRKGQEAFAAASVYADWKFTFVPGAGGEKPRATPRNP